MIDGLIRSLRRTFRALSERMSEAFAAVTHPVERAFAATFGRLFRALEGLQHVEVWLLGLLKFVTWPVRILGRGVAAVFSAVLPEEFRHRWAARMAGLGGGLVRLAERLNLDVPVRWLAWLLQPLWRPVAAVGGFAYAWLATRPWRQMAWGLPAVLLLTPVLATAGWAALWGQGSVAARYKLAVKEALEAKDFKLMQFYETKLAQLGVDSTLANYRTAVALGEEGKLEEAYERMQTLIPEEGPGFPGAHGWILQQLFAGKLEPDRAQAHVLAGGHLDALEKLGVETAELKLMRALWLADDQRLEEALKLIKPLVLQMPEAAIASLQLHVQLRNLDGAREDARVLIAAAAKWRRQEKPLSLSQCQWWATAAEVLADDEQMIEAIRAWLELEPENERAQLALSEGYRRLYERLLGAAAPSTERLVQLLTSAARHPASRVWAESQINGLMLNRPLNQTAAEVVARLVDSTETPPVLIEAIGTWLALHGDAVESRKLLERSLGEDSTNAIAWNNYAWTLGQGENPDLKGALDAVNKALALSPDEHRFRETRGQILARLARWDEAIADLEYALNGMPTLPAIHATLADAYEAKGEQEIAQMHRREAE